jgi:hypothetical protein
MEQGKVVGQKAPLKLKGIWALRVQLQIKERVREPALLNMGIDSKLRGCDLVSLEVRDICHGDQLVSRATVMQRKTKRPGRFEISPATRDAVQSRRLDRGTRPRSSPPRHPLDATNQGDLDLAAQLLLGHSKLESTVR